MVVIVLSSSLSMLLCSMWVPGSSRAFTIDRLTSEVLGSMCCHKLCVFLNCLVGQVCSLGIVMLTYLLIFHSD
jgi:hypothetical protein